MDKIGDEYRIKRELTPLEERDLLEFIDPYASYIEFSTEANRLVGFGIYNHKRNEFFFAQVAALGDDDDYDGDFGPH